MIRFILWSSISIHMTDRLALASELNPTTWYDDPWLYLIGLLIILIFVMILIFGVNFARPKVKAGSIKSFPAPHKSRLFSIYYREPTSKSIQFRGKVIERRLKERGNNFKDLLGKVRRDYSFRVIDPNGIFLQASSYQKDQR